MRGLLALTLLLGGWLVGCAPGPVRTMSEHAVMPDYSNDVVEALRDHPVKVEVRGDPFGLPAGAFAGQIAAAMSDVRDMPALAFSSRDLPDLAPGYRVVWDFAARRGPAPDELCGAATPPIERPALPIDAYAVLCRDDKALSAVRVRLYYTDTPNSLEFIALVDAATRALFPDRPPAFRRVGTSRLAPWAPHVAR
ncbi:MAG: hypothetical protein JO021_17245 [Alphaproteobacteria bacterium]|nr:hypothetical protein [Alphaproteobacteria bacterium]